MKELETENVHLLFILDLGTIRRSMVSVTPLQTHRVYMGQYAGPTQQMIKKSFAHAGDLTTDFQLQDTD